MGDVARDLKRKDLFICCIVYLVRQATNDLGRIVQANTAVAMDR